jgi:hypothetical protein
MNDPYVFGTPDAPGDSPLEVMFWDFHRANPEVYAYFRRFTSEAIRAHHTKFRVAAVIERIRWETNVITRDPSGTELKIPNNTRPFYARLWMKDNPGWPEFFRTAVIRSSASYRRKDEK